MPMYNENVLDHFMNPRNAGEILDPDGVSMVRNPQCGDTMKLFIRVVGGIIADCKWQTSGCGAAISTSSIASEMVKGKPTAEAAMLNNRAIANALGGLPPGKMHCSILAADALKEALKDYQRRQEEKVGEIGDASATTTT